MTKPVWSHVLALSLWALKKAHIHLHDIKAISPVSLLKICLESDTPEVTESMHYSRLGLM